MKRLFWIGLAVLLVCTALWLAARRKSEPDVAFVKASRGTLVSTLSTNGKTEPLHWEPIPTEREGRVLQVHATKGQTLPAGSLIVTLDSSGADAEIAAAEARLAQAKLDLANLKKGGRAAELADIDGAINRLRVDRDAAKREAATLARLEAKQAATTAELDAAKDRLAQIDVQIVAQEARRAALTGAIDISVAESRVRDAEAALALAQSRQAKASIRSRAAGTVYELPVRENAWLNSGDLVAKVGEVSKLKVVIYVDEPDLGRVQRGQPVLLTWDAMPGREWKGVVEQIPVQVSALGTRQVGEVLTIADNPMRDLPPGANINAQIRTQVVDNALMIPKQALRREEGEFGVFVLNGDRVVWRKVKLGASSETQSQILSGLADGDLIALPTEIVLKDGMKVAPQVR